MLTVSSFVTLSEWFIRITEALSNLGFLFGYFVGAWLPGLVLVLPVSLYLIHSSISMKGAMTQNKSTAMQCFRVLPNIPELQCSPVEPPSLLLWQQLQHFKHWLQTPTQLSHGNSFQQRPAPLPALLSVCCLPGSRRRRKLLCPWYFGVWSPGLKYRC